VGKSTHDTYRDNALELLDGFGELRIEGDDESSTAGRDAVLARRIEQDALYDGRVRIIDHDRLALAVLVFRAARAAFSWRCRLCHTHQGLDCQQTHMILRVQHLGRFSEGCAVKEVWQFGLIDLVRASVIYIQTTAHTGEEGLLRSNCSNSRLVRYSCCQEVWLSE